MSGFHNLVTGVRALGESLTTLAEIAANYELTLLSLRIQLEAMRVREQEVRNLRTKEWTLGLTYSEKQRLYNQK